MNKLPDDYISLEEQARRMNCSSDDLRAWIKWNKVSHDCVLKFRNRIYVKPEIAFLCPYPRAIAQSNGYICSGLVPEGYVSVWQWAQERSIPQWQALDWLMSGKWDAKWFHMRGLVRYIDANAPIPPGAKLLVMACSMMLLMMTPAIAQDVPAFSGQNVVPEVYTIHGEIKPREPYVGLGWGRSRHLACFPFKHPVLAFHKGTYPLRHPLQAFKKFGELAEPYQPGLNALSSLSGPCTTAGVFSKGGI